MRDACVRARVDKRSKYKRRLDGVKSGLHNLLATTLASENDATYLRAEDVIGTGRNFSKGRKRLAAGTQVEELVALGCPLVTPSIRIGMSANVGLDTRGKLSDAVSESDATIDIGILSTVSCASQPSRIGNAYWIAPHTALECQQRVNHYNEWLV